MRTGRVSIEKPIWNGGQPHIGIADFRCRGLDLVEVEILYTRKSDGKRSYDGLYSMKVADLMKSPTQTVRGGVKLYVAPLHEWEHKL